ncbi:MAG: helix-turn-helix domain-containing protein [Hyphomicrobiales bacterium]|nr:helix-turn-helix domain-containing protein [Hyphomicrobiales bacterium]
MPRVKRNRTEQRTADAGGPDFLEALARALRIIQTFNRDRRQLTLSDIAKLVDLPRASVRRTLHTLIHLGFAETDGRVFRLRPRILTLAGAYLMSNSISDILQPAVERMAAEVGEASSAAVLDGDDVIMIAHALPNRVVNVSAQIGFRLPAVSSSLGRVLLAALDDRELDLQLRRMEPKKLTSATVVDRAELRRLILKARDDGFSLVDQEAEPGFCSISVPLRRLDGRVIAALNIGTHSNRTTLGAMRKVFLPRLRALATDLQSQMI